MEVDSVHEMTVVVMVVTDPVIVAEVVIITEEGVRIETEEEIEVGIEIVVVGEEGLVENVHRDLGTTDYGRLVVWLIDWLID